jgi:hypothetical protein
LFEVEPFLVLISLYYSVKLFSVLQSLKAELRSQGEKCAQEQNRTADTRIFSPLLYQLSYLGIAHPLALPDFLLIKANNTVALLKRKPLDVIVIMKKNQLQGV